MAKGYRGQTCAEAIYDVVASHEPVGFPAIFDAVSGQGPWARHTIYQQLMKWIVNLPPAHYQWPSSRARFLFLRPDGLYELHNEAKHGVFVEGTRIDVVQSISRSAGGLRDRGARVWPTHGIARTSRTGIAQRTGGGKGTSRRSCTCESGTTGCASTAPRRSRGTT